MFCVVVGGLVVLIWISNSLLQLLDLLRLNLVFFYYLIGLLLHLLDVQFQLLLQPNMLTDISL